MKKGGKAADKRRTANHIAYMKDIAANAARIAIHGRFLKFEEADFYPEHDHRKDSEAYKKIHNELIVKKNLPCLVCGVTNKVIKDPKKRNGPKANPGGARQIETHHHIVEWALADAVDPEKFNRTIRLHLKDRHKGNSLYKNAMNQKQIRDWVDHSPDNLWVLCDVHHRHKYAGIHHITYPLWSPQNLLTDGFESQVQKKIEEESVTHAPHK